MMFTLSFLTRLSAMAAQRSLRTGWMIWALASCAVGPTLAAAQQGLPHSPFRDAWKLVEVFYPDIAAQPTALAAFHTQRLSVASMARPRADRGWNFAGPLSLRVQREGSSAPAWLDAEFTSDVQGRVRSMVLSQCEIFDAAALVALSKELTRRGATDEEVDQRLKALFALYPPSRGRAAKAEFQEKFHAAAAILGRMDVDEIRFGAPPARDPSDKTVDLHWQVTGKRGPDEFVALFEPIGGRLVSLQLRM